MNGIFSVPAPRNEEVKSYAPGSPERATLKKALHELRSKTVNIPMYIGDQEVYTDDLREMRPPHDRKHLLGTYNMGTKEHVKQAIAAALAAKASWENMDWQDRAAIFLRAADLLAGPYRAKMNAATMLAQSKNPYQAEIDAACELIDFFRFNVHYMQEIYMEQPPVNPAANWNRLEYRPLEGFVFALTPFNFTSIAGNLPTAPALMGNTVVWKASETQIYSAQVIVELLKEAGLPNGVINLVHVPGPEAGEVIFKHPDFAGIHFTGSTGVFRNIWREIGNNIDWFKSYPRIVGETGGKDFIMAHNSADVDVLATALSRGAFEFQGQKCSAASRAYIPESLWEAVKEKLFAQLNDMKMGPAEDFSNFINAVIDEKSFDKISGYIDRAKNDHSEVKIIYGGNCNKEEGFFIQPTILQTTNPEYVTMCEELFGPVLTIYVYQDDEYSRMLEILDNTSIYALTGAIIANDREAIRLATHKLKNAAGNFYINDKPTGAVVGQQPFGGARASGTNDKAGAKVNLMRWVSMRTIKENFVPPKDYRYPFLEEEC